MRLASSTRSCTGLSCRECKQPVVHSIDGNEWPHKVLLVRGRASVEMLDDVSPEYERAAARYFGPEQGAAWVGTLRGKPMARIAITPGWVGILDFETRFPSALTL